MKPEAPGRSLRLQLLLGTLAWVLLAIGLAGWGLRALFGDHVREQLGVQLVQQLDQLSAALDWVPGKGVALGAAAALDPRLSQPLSGLYWQVDRLGEAPQAGLLRSRSLWDQALALPPLPEDYPAQGHRMFSLPAAQGHVLLAVARTLELPEGDAPPLRRQLRETVLASAELFKVRPYFLSAEFSLLDACVAPILWRLPHFGIDLPKEAQSIMRYAANIFPRPGFRASLTGAEQQMRVA